MYSGDEQYGDEITSGISEDDRDNEEELADCGHYELPRMMESSGGQDLCRNCFAKRLADVKRIPARGK